MSLVPVAGQPADVVQPDLVMSGDQPEAPADLRAGLFGGGEGPGIPRPDPGLRPAVDYDAWHSRGFARHHIHGDNISFAEPGITFLAPHQIDESGQLSRDSQLVTRSLRNDMFVARRAADRVSNTCRRSHLPDMVSDMMAEIRHLP